MAKIPHIKHKKKGRIFHPAVKEEAEDPDSGDWELSELQGLISARGGSILILEWGV
jgi:hypothetical protein